MIQFQIWPFKQQHVKAIPAERLLPWQTPGCCPSRWGGAAPHLRKNFGGRELTEEGPRVLDHAHLDVPILEELYLTAAAAAVEGSSCCRAPLCDSYSPPAAALLLLHGHFPQQRLTLFGRIKLIVVQLVSSTRSR